MEKAVTLILGKERLEVNEEVFREILVRALYANGLDEPDGVDLLAHRLLTWLDRAGEKPSTRLVGESSR